MITIIYSTHKSLDYNKSFKEHLKKTIGIKNYEILEYENFNQFTLAEIYNKGIRDSKNDIIVCCHNDIKLESDWGKKLLKDFEKNPDYGIIGKAGSCYFPESGIYWERMHQTMVGHVYHQPEGQKKWLSKYSSSSSEIIPVVTIDGLFMSFNKTKIKHLFDETIGKFHFYDHSFCVPNFNDGVKIGVTFSFDIIHQSVGQPNDEFFKSKDVFVEKYKSILPIDLKPKKILYEHIKEKPIKNIGKVAVIILTKGKVEMLYDCVKSFYDHCNSNLFTIFIADTGSLNEEKEWIKDNIIPLGDVQLIEYNYYNFAKINNDVVKNHVNGDYEFLLFCNNDIKLLNNVIYGMLNVFKTKNNVGTVGCRLHFGDNTIQHDGIVMYIPKEQKLEFTHHGLKSYYNYRPSLNLVVGSTGALLMIKKNLFNSIGYFNEGYENCFEDVELNLQCLLRGHYNYYDGNLVAYHYESMTRKEENKINVTNDYINVLMPFVNKNLEKLNKYIIKV